VYTQAPARVSSVIGVSSAFTVPTQREIPLDGCFNFRDLGGYSTEDGRVVRWRTLFRSDGLHRLSGADLDHLRQLGVATVIDLRTAEELEVRGRVEDICEGMSFYHLPVLDALPDASVTDQWRDPVVLGRHYAEMAEHGAGAIADALAVLTDPSAYPAVFHCAAGKDRTGILAALVLGLIGVSDDTIVADYAASAPAMERMLEHLLEAYPDGRSELERRASVMLASEPAAMHEFLATLRRQYGSLEGFVESIGVKSATEYLRSALLEKP
jgi:protein-tyrosine phosphatase